jgi:hypothetical protein
MWAWVSKVTAGNKYEKGTVVEFQGCVEEQLMCGEEREERKKNDNNNDDD